MMLLPIPPASLPVGDGQAFGAVAANIPAVAESEVVVISTIAPAASSSTQPQPQLQLNRSPVGAAVPLCQLQQQLKPRAASSSSSSSSSSLMHLDVPVGREADENSDESEEEGGNAEDFSDGSMAGSKRLSTASNSSSVVVMSVSRPAHAASPSSSMAFGADAEAGSGSRQEVMMDVVEDGSALGRGKRQVKSRTLMVNGHLVLRQNNYEVVGEQYIYGSQQTEYVSREQKPSMKALKALKPPEVPRVRKESELMMRLRRSNEAIKHDKAIAASKRQRFLLHHLDTLEPFLHESVLKEVRALQFAPKTAHGRVEEPKPLASQPDYIEGGEMRDYQLHGLSWLISCYQNGIGAILGDEMGLGKTVQTISFLAYLKLERKLPGPSLVVCPLSVIAGWMTEFKRWCPTLRVIRLHTSDLEERRWQCSDVLPDVEAYDVIVTTFEMMKNPVCRHMLVQSIHWRTVVFDEGHMLKNEHAEVSVVARKLHAQTILLLTGTPLQNNLHELWALLALLFPEVFGRSSEMFDDCFVIGNGESHVDKSMLEKAHHLLKPFMLRRLKAEVETSLPPRIETRVDCPLSDMQLFWYKRLLLKEKEALSRYERDDKKDKSSSDWKRLAALWVQLRKCCNHPFLFPGAEAPGGAGTTVTDMVQASGKLQVMDRLLDKLQLAGHRVVIFSQYTHTLDILDDYLSMKGVRYTRLDGSTNRVQRYVNITSFNAPNSKLFCFIMTTRAGGLGVNLQTADTVILFDSDWNPQPDLQAMARVHRIGQKKVVHVYRLVSTGTIEERIVQHSEKKLYLDQMVNRDQLVVGAAQAALRGEVADAPEHKEDLLASLTFGADRIFKAESGNMLTDAELDAIIDRTTTQEEREQQQKDDANAPQVLQADKKDAASFDPQSAYRSIRDLQGVTYEKAPTTLTDIGQEWLQELSDKKRVGKARVQMVDGKGSGYGGVGGMVPVLSSNAYTLESGEASVFEMELYGRMKIEQCRVGKRKVMVAGKDYSNDDFCLSCWDGGDLVCCDQCPASYHKTCLGLKRKDLEDKRKWGCPQHRCAECDRGCGAVGGMLFRCLVCPLSFCLDHLPDEHVIDGQVNLRFESLGYGANKTACYIYCSVGCKDYGETLTDHAATLYHPHHRDKGGDGGGKNKSKKQRTTTPPPV